MFEPGDIVECVDAGPLRIPPPYFGRPSGLILAAVYTIQAFHPLGSPGRLPGRRWRMDCVDLLDMPHPHPLGAFHVGRFRLLKRKDPDMLDRLLHASSPAVAELT